MEFRVRTYSHSFTFPTLFLLLLFALSGVAFIAPHRSQQRLVETSSTRTVQPSFGSIDLHFEENRGQADKDFDFLARGDGYAMFLKPTEATLMMSRREEEPPAMVRLQLINSNQHAKSQPVDRMPGTVNYFIGQKADGWRTNVPTFKRVQYRDVYSGVDMVYYGNQRQLEYDFVLSPGTNPDAIKLQFEGADQVELNDAGDLLLTIASACLRQPKPIVYQTINGTRREIDGRYSLSSKNEIGFAVGEYDERYPLVIDPTLLYSTFLGGSGSDEARDVVVDTSGNVYVCGNTSSTNFPVFNAFQPTFGGGNFVGARDVFVTKFNATGTAIFYSTYLGGGGDDKCGRLAIDASGNAYIAGETTSNNFPTFSAFQNFYGGGASDAFVTKLNSAGSAIFYSTYLGGSLFDAAGAIALDLNGSAYITGRTTSSNFPTFNALQPFFSGGTNADAFITKLTPNGLGVSYSTYLGGSGGLGFDAGNAIAVDPAGNAYVAGQTSSTNFPLVNPAQGFFGGGSPDGDAFVSKINSNGSALFYSTYIGGIDNDAAFDIALDASRNAYITGSTGSNNFPVINAFQSVYGGNGDAFLTKLNASGSLFVFSTYLGGTSNDAGNGVAVDSSDHAHVAGVTASTNFPVFRSLQDIFNGGGSDAFISRFNFAGNALIYSTFLGGTGADRANAIAIDLSDNAYVAGITGSSDFPISIAAFQPNRSAAEDAFVGKISDPPATLVRFNSANTTVVEDCTSVTITVNRTGDLTGSTSVDFSTTDGSAIQRTDYTLANGTLNFAAGETSKTFTILISEDAYVEGNENFNVILNNPLGGGIGTIASSVVTIVDDDTINPPVSNPIDDPNLFVRQHYHDFLAREGDAGGIAFWTNVITQCGNDQACINAKRIDVSNAFSFENEFQQTGAYVFRVYRESFGNNQPLANPDPDPLHANEEKKIPLYLPFMRDRARVRGGGQLAQLQLDLATLFVQRAEFVAKYPLTLDGRAFVDAMLNTIRIDIGVNLSSQRQALINLYNQATTVTDARALVVYRLADDNSANPINNGTFIDAEYNRAFVYNAYAGYLRRDADMAGFLFWLDQISSASLRDVTRQHAMVCAFITSAEYQSRFSSAVTHNNGECH